MRGRNTGINARTQMLFADILHKDHAHRHPKNAGKKRFNKLFS